MAELWFRLYTAEFFVVYEFCYSLLFATRDARLIFLQLQDLKIRSKSVEVQQLADKRFTNFEEQFYGFVRLDAADDSRQHAENPGFRATRNFSGWRRLGIKTAIAGTFFGPKNACLPFEAKNGAVDVWFFEKHTGVVHQIARCEIVCSVYDDIVIFKNPQCVFAFEGDVMRFDLDVWIYPVQFFFGAQGFLFADVACEMQDLPVKIRFIHHVEIQDSESADARGSEVIRSRRAEAACADDEGRRAFQLFLARRADFRHDDVARVSGELFGSQIWHPVLQIMISKLPVVLASASPRRKELMARLFDEFEIVPSEVDETPPPGIAPEELAVSLAWRKAQDVFRHRPHALVIACDTVVALCGTIFGKPANAVDSKEMLQALSGKTHSVITGVCFIAYGNARTFFEETRVSFRTLGLQEIESYIATGEPLDKAGSYAIQGGAGKFVKEVDGDVDNVVGLPVAKLRSELLAADLAKM